ncbi:MAG TPA: hypothetical protein VFL42_00955 [Terriglobales bacterium]|nr:hypothetical protein [Terriglobales bacterium]
MQEELKIAWIEADKNPWGVRVLDVRAVTQGMIATSQDPQCAANAISYGNDDGSAFLAQPPIVESTFSAGLLYRTAGPLGEGALFRPAVMEHKWAIFHRQNKLLIVRGWLRRLFAVAEVEQWGDMLAVGTVRGAFAQENEPEEYSVRFLDFLVRSHALGEIHPAPLFPGEEEDMEQAALACFSAFGNMALFAATERPSQRIPEGTLKLC